MKFLYFGYDFMLPSVIGLIEAGHELIGVFSFECDNHFNFNTETQVTAQNLGIPFILSKPQDFHIAEFLAKGCTCFLAAGYPHKIPPIEDAQAYAVNVHPAYLPYARGLMPIPRIIMDHASEAAGITAHKMTDVFDDGDILRQLKFDLSPNETPETYMAKIAMRAPFMLKGLFADLPALWSAAKPQNTKKATHYSPPSDEDRFLDWNKTAREVDRTARAFGRFGSLARIEDQIFVVYDCVCWTEKHTIAPGTIAARTSREITLALKDGFICLTELYPANE
jgi:methionyl-tRNA formyltransferase